LINTNTLRARVEAGLFCFEAESNLQIAITNHPNFKKIIFRNSYFES